MGIGNLDQRKSIGKNCKDYVTTNSEFQSSIMPSQRSCDNCIHFVNKKCDINVYDDVLTSLDQT